MNNVVLCGKVENLRLDHKYRGEDYYSATVLIKRDSGYIDRVNILTKESVLPECACIRGKIRSYTRRDIDKNRLIIYVQAMDVRYAFEDENENIIEIDGQLVQSPQLRKTPLGKDICDLIIGVKRTSGRVDYIPCIAWGKLAHVISEMRLGDDIQVVGRLQSREYEKHTGDITEIRTAFELSIFEVK